MNTMMNSRGRALLTPDKLGHLNSANVALMGRIADALIAGDNETYFALEPEWRRSGLAASMHAHWSGRSAKLTLDTDAIYAKWNRKAH